jgi:hypothetical protein
MFFAAILISVFLARCFRGCAKYVVIAILLAVIANKDPVLWSKLSQLFNEAWHAVREWIVSE